MNLETLKIANDIQSEIESLREMKKKIDCLHYKKINGATISSIHTEIDRLIQELQKQFNEL